MPMPQLTDRIKEAPATLLRALFAGVGQVLLAVDKVRTDVLDQQRKAGSHPEQDQPAAAEASPAGQPASTEGAGNVRVLREEDGTAAGPPAGTPAEEAAAGIQAAEPQAAEPQAAATAAESEAKPARARKAASKPRTAGKAGTAGKQGTAGKTTAEKPATARRTTAGKTAAGPATAKPATAKPATAKPATAKPAGEAAPPSAQTPPVATPPLPNYDELTIASLRARMRGMDATRVQALLQYERAHAGRDEVVAMFERRLAKIAGEAG